MELASQFREKNIINFKSAKWMIIFGIILTVIMNTYYFSSATTEISTQGTKETKSVNQIILDNSEQYASGMGCVVAASVNPLGTLLAISGIGYLQSLEMDALTPFFATMSENGYDFSALPLANFQAVIVLLIIFSVRLLIDCFKGTQLFSLGILKKIEDRVGQLSVMLITFLGTSSITSMAAASAEQGEIGSRISSMVMSFLLTLATAIIYFFVKTLITFLDIMAYLASGIEKLLPLLPISSVIASIESAKASTVAALTVISFLTPFQSLFFSLTILVISIALFRKATIAIIYFKNIYVNGFWNALFHRTKVFDLVDEHIPEKIAERFERLDVAIMAFPIMRIKGFYRKAKCWLVVSDNKVYLCKLLFWTKVRVLCISDMQQEADCFYLRQSIRFIKLTTKYRIELSNKPVSIILNRRYHTVLDELLTLMQAKDYNLEMALLSEEKKRSKIIKVQENKQILSQMKEERTKLKLENKKPRKTFFKKKSKEEETLVEVLSHGNLEESE